MTNEKENNVKVMMTPLTIADCQIELQSLLHEQ
jgi:hypothetical protein